MVEQIIKQVEPKNIYLIMISLIALVLLAAYLYAFKHPWSRFITWQLQLQEMQGEQIQNSKLHLELEQLRNDITILKQTLQGNHSGLHAKQLESYLITQLDQMAERHGVILNGVTPGSKTEVLMFNELPFHIQITGAYEHLYSWLDEVETKLGPIAVKKFEIHSRDNSNEIQELRLTIVSYQHNG